jgi:hypothetical protein
MALLKELVDLYLSEVILEITQAERLPHHLLELLMIKAQVRPVSKVAEIAYFLALMVNTFMQMGVETLFPDQSK